MNGYDFIVQLIGDSTPRLVLLLGGVIALVSIIVSALSSASARVRIAQLDHQLKAELAGRGFSAEDIERVIKASAPVPAEESCGDEPGSAATPSIAKALEAMAENSYETQDITAVAEQLRRLESDPAKREAFLDACETVRRLADNSVENIAAVITAR
jgi:hypothetical protein